MDTLVRQAIAHILRDNTDLLRIAVRQRAKFEGWLKFELASRLEAEGMHAVEVETAGADGRGRTDITFSRQDGVYGIELKTPNTNWRVEGIRPCTRPITKNIQSIVDDTKKLSRGRNIVAFVLFPVPDGDTRWRTYIKRIAIDTGLPVSCNDHCEIVALDLGCGDSCDLVVCAFEAGESLQQSCAREGQSA